jgi:hypothetical protein
MQLFRGTFALMVVLAVSSTAGAQVTGGVMSVTSSHMS